MFSCMAVISRTRDNSPSMATDNKGFAMKHESYMLTVLGRRQSVARGLIEEIVKFGSKPSESIKIYSSRFGYWQSRGVGSPRKLDSVVLPRGQSEMILKDAIKFMNSADWYRSVGIPWHRGYLLSGKAGAGKTSLVSAIAGELKMDLYLLNISGSNMDDERLVGLMADVRPGTIVLMEDVDCTFPDRDTSKEAKGVTLSGLLNCLDGIQSREGCLIFMTSNYADKLDPALVRPGRVDVKLEFGYATLDQAMRLRDRIAPDFPDELLERCDVMTMAEVQQLLLDGQTNALYKNNRELKKLHTT